MVQLLWRWINERWPLQGLIRVTLEEEIVGGSRYAYTLGSAVLIVFLIQAVSGLLQMFFYVPTVDHAYDSVSYLRTQVAFGWLIHGLHYWGANAMVVLVTLHMARVFIWGAYKRPRELTWLMGVTLLLTTMAFSFTGGPLHWDQRGYWAGEVGTSIAGTAPVVGNLMKRLLRGGEEMGQLALSRLFAAHVMLLPAALLALFGIHITAMRRFGSVGPWEESKRQGTGPFWPDQMYKDTVTGTLVVLLLIGLAAFLPPSYSGKADPLDTAYVPKAEWNFLFLYEALKYFQGPLEAVGTVGVPAVLVTLLMLLPFIDRNPVRDPFRRPIAMLCGLLFAGGIITLSVIGYLSPGFAQTPLLPSDKAAAETTGEAPSVPDDSIRRGEQVFRTSGCSGCHAVAGEGGTIGPELSAATLAGRDRQWLAAQIRTPKSHNPDSVMPAYTGLSGQEVEDLVSYLLSLGRGGDTVRPKAKAREVEKAAAPAAEARKETNLPMALPAGPAAYVIGGADHGAELFKRHCSSCHGPEGKGGLPNPGSAERRVPGLSPIAPKLYSPEARQFAENIDTFIQHGSVPAGAAPAVRMPAFGDTNSLTQQEIANIEAYVLRLNGVDRGQIVNPGMQPRRFFLVVLAVYATVFLVQGGWRFRKDIP